MKLKSLIIREKMAGLARKGEDREFAEYVFAEWRDRYVAELCRYIRILQGGKVFASRLRDAAEAAGFSADLVKTPTSGIKPYRSAEWCNAAVHLLTIPDEEIQDWFLRSTPERKDEIVAAVLKDGGIENMNGFFVELPPL